MTSRATRCMETLSVFGELEWFKLVSGPDSLRGYQQVPYLAWRYDSPGEGVVEVFERALQSKVERTMVSDRAGSAS
ncbi:hypothetical protein [Streptomyces sp. NPDC014685]|uniref:hypothetical protein n=1 Tax=Streptomyces sp. NPDC014685 TaxID=3364881 RepID=UPI0036F75A45